MKDIEDNLEITKCLPVLADEYICQCCGSICKIITIKDKLNVVMKNNNESWEDVIHTNKFADDILYYKISDDKINININDAGLIWTKNNVYAIANTSFLTSEPMK